MIGMSPLIHASVIVRNALATCFQGYFSDRRAALTSEDGGIGMQAAIVAGGLVASGIIVAMVLRNRASQAGDALTLPATAATSTVDPTPP